VLPALLLLPVYLQPPLQTVLFPPEQTGFCKVHESQPSSLAHAFSNASQMVFQTLSALLSVYLGRVVLEWKYHQLMLQYSCKEPSDGFEFYVTKNFIKTFSKNTL
jgi:hypothetical protein